MEFTETKRRKKYGGFDEMPMNQRKRIYLAGPEVFLPNASEVLGSRKRVLEKYDFVVYSPFDGNIPENLERNEVLARRIFEENCRLIRESDWVIANCNFFRGTCVDDGTSFEIGYAFQLGKRIYGHRESSLPLPMETAKRIPTTMHESGFRIDGEGFLLNEDFGNRINLMLEYSIEASGGNLIRGSFEDLASYLSIQEAGLS